MFASFASFWPYNLTPSPPSHITAATGMDALTHHIESYLSPAYPPLCGGIALEGTRISAAAAALLTAFQLPGNLKARSDMMMASTMGATVFKKTWERCIHVRMRRAPCATCTTAWLMR